MSALTTWLTAIADAIRGKDGTALPIDHADFPGRITAIATGNDTSDATALVSDILAPKTAYIATGKVTGTCTFDSDTSDATADAYDIYDGKTAYVNGVKITGDMYGYGGVTPGEVPSDWPDIHAIVAADVQAGYAYKYIYLMADDYTYSTFTVTATNIAFKTSDGDFYTSTTTHNWDLAQDIATSIYKVRWVIVYSNTEALTVALPYEVLWLDMYSAKGSASGYSGFRRLRSVDGTFQTGFTSALSMFSNCYSLTRVPDVLDLSACSNASNMFNGCKSLTRAPDILDVSGCMSVASMFAYCNSLTRVPQMTIATASPAQVAPNFAQSTRVNSDYKSTVATFDGGGVVNGGMVYNLATVTTARSLTLNATIKGLFTGAEQTAIANNLNGKNWSLVW